MKCNETFAIIGWSIMCIFIFYGVSRFHTLVSVFALLQQIMVQKVTMLAFSLHDGKVKKIDELNEIQKREAIK
uniref:Uncharacterized protein n=1 Tax=Wuchereria bancrofti TaxID=6293 RepID=A0A1I8EJR2_WUCBA